MPESTVAIDARITDHFDVTINVGEGSAVMPYELRGKRGARYGLVRNVPNPEMLFVVSLRGISATTKARGWTWFTDKGNLLKPVS